LNNKVHKIDSSQSPTPAKATYGPATSGLEWDLANGGGLMANVSATIGRLKIPPKAAKVITGVQDGVATLAYTVTVPNAMLSASFEVDLLAIIGAGGAIGAGEAIKLAKYQITVVRTAGVNAVATIGAVIGGSSANVAGATTVSVATVTLGAVSGAVGVVNTFPINITITKAGGASQNHIAAIQAEFQHEWISGITVA
jgi:hypothetical protein